ncbi:MAG: hypothetical protein JSW21_07990 [Gammaproteobacteria bacterium]|jgi:hypothetical protein|nr:MAG: hypothetical protein JSW21_07990 [Gammaproteobacteria bacterium]
MNLVQEILYELLEASEPRSLLCVADTPLSSVHQYKTHVGGCEVETIRPETALETLGRMGRFDFALLSGALEILDVQMGSALIARIRDVHCHRFALACRHQDANHRDGAWSEPMILALALALHRRIDLDGVWHSIYTYDIDSYNPEREWNNPESWANPGNFRRYRW